MLVADPSSNFCPEHNRTLSKSRNAADLSSLLTAGLTEFKSAVMAYTCNLLLRTIPAIDRERGIKEKEKEKEEEEEVHLDFGNWPDEVRFVKGDAPPPPPPGADLPAVVRRSLGYLSSADRGSQDSGNIAPTSANGAPNSGNGAGR